MKKTLLALPLFAGAAWAGSTYLSSTQSREAYEQLLATLNSRQALSFESESYESGFNSSTAITRVLVGDGDKRRAVLRLRHEIDHNPVSLGEGDARLSAARIVTTLYREAGSDDAAGGTASGADTDAGIDDAWLDDVLPGFGDAEPFVATTDISFTGESSNRLVVAPFASDIDTGRVEFDGADVTIGINDQRLKGSGTFGAIRVDSGEGDDILVAFSPSTMDYDFDAVRARSMIGTSSLRVDEIKVLQGETPLVTLGNTVISSDSRHVAESDTYDATMVFGIDRILSPAPVDRASWTMTFADLPAAAMDRYNERYWQDPVGATIDDRMDNLMLLKDMLQPKAHMGNAVSLGNAGGTMATAFGMTWLTPLAEFEKSPPMTVGDLLSHLDLTLTLDADVAAVQSTPAIMLLSNPVAQAYVIEKDDKYVSDIHVAGGIFTANGASMPLDAVVGDLVNMPLSMMMPRPAPTDR